MCPKGKGFPGGIKIPRDRDNAHPLDRAGFPRGNTTEFETLNMNCVSQPPMGPYYMIFGQIFSSDRSEPAESLSVMHGLKVLKTCSKFGYWLLVAHKCPLDPSLIFGRLSRNQSFNFVHDLHSMCILIPI